MNGYRTLLLGILPTILLSSGLLAPALAAQDPSKMGVIDVERILQDSVRGKAVLEELNQLSQQKKTELDAKGAELVQLQNEYTQKRLSLAEDRLAEMEQRLEDLQIDLRRAEDDAKREVQQVQQQKFAEIENLVLPIIDEVGKELGFALIFNKRLSGLVYADAAADVTDLVIDRFNSQSGAGN